ncbi:hypothetical protein TNCV_4027441 [Trichonephila clavipes]|nr:hypothetical protein TNCV_4027441 [Trichonephila clavipes]
MDSSCCSLCHHGNIDGDHLFLASKSVEASVVRDIGLIAERWQKCLSQAKDLRKSRVENLKSKENCFFICDSVSFSKGKNVSS